MFWVPCGKEANKLSFGTVPANRDHLWWEGCKYMCLHLGGVRVTCGTVLREVQGPGLWGHYV